MSAQSSRRNIQLQYTFVLSKGIITAYPVLTCGFGLLISVEEYQK